MWVLIERNCSEINIWGKEKKSDESAALIGLDWTGCTHMGRGGGHFENDLIEKEQDEGEEQGMHLWECPLWLVGKNSLIRLR